MLKLINSLQKSVVRSFIIAALFLFIMESPKVCPNLERSFALSSNLISSRENVVLLEGRTEKLFDISLADTIGIFLLDDNLDYLIKVTYLSKDGRRYLNRTIYPITDDVQKDVYRRSASNGCVAESVDDLEEGVWKRSLQRVGTQSGIICSIKDTSYSNNSLKGLLTFEYTQSEFEIDPKFILNSVEYYRNIIARDLLDLRSQYDPSQDRLDKLTTLLKRNSSYDQ